jgi:hypothetical protein
VCWGGEEKIWARQGEREGGADDEEGFVCGRGGSPGRTLMPEIFTCCLRRDDGVGWREGRAEDDGGRQWFWRCVSGHAHDLAD